MKKITAFTYVGNFGQTVKSFEIECDKALIEKLEPSAFSLENAYKHFPGGSVGFVQLLSHTGELIPLAGKDEGYSTHAVALRRMTSASSTTSRTMSAAGCS